MKKEILNLYKDCLYQKLNAYYAETTLFNIIHSERNENRHSAFLCWLLNPEGSHELKNEPLKKLLSLYASKMCGKNIENNLLTGEYDFVEVNECTNEKVLRDLTHGNERRRIDIWIDVTIKVDNTVYELPIIIENKIYALEHGDQTKSYHMAVEAFCMQKEKEGVKCCPIEIFLTPERSQCGCESFTHISYQELLDFVIEPVEDMSRDPRSRIVIQDYIKNLVIPTTALDSDNDMTKAIKEIRNTIIAVPDKVRKDLEILYSTHKELIDRTICVNGGNNAQTLFPQYAFESAETIEMLEGLWNSNFCLFLMMLYICRSTIKPGQEDKLIKLFQISRRDTSKYHIQIKDNNGNWVTAAAYPKPMSKGMTVAAFFTLFTQGKNYSGDMLRRIFPSTISTYYSHITNSEKWGNSVVWELCAGPDDEEFNKQNPNLYRQSYVKAENGFMVKLSDATWDFYQDYRIGFTSNSSFCIVKMWRKDDFNRFMEHIRKPVALPIATPGVIVMQKQDVFSNMRIVEINPNEL